MPPFNLLLLLKAASPVTYFDNVTKSTVGYFTKQGADAYTEAGTWLTYNDVQSVKAIAQWEKDQGLAGTFIYSADMDTPAYTLMNAIADVIKGPSPSPSPPPPPPGRFACQQSVPCGSGGTLSRCSSHSIELGAMQREPWRGGHPFREIGWCGVCTTAACVRAYLLQPTCACHAWLLPGPPSPPGPPTGTPTCSQANQAALCKTVCASTCRGFPPGFASPGCAVTGDCTSPPAWAKNSVCTCP